MRFLPRLKPVGFLAMVIMKDTLKTIFGFLEYVALFFVSYYGIKYCFVAGPIYFGSPWGFIIAGIFVALFIFHLLKKKGL